MSDFLPDPSTLLYIAYLVVFVLFCAIVGLLVDILRILHLILKHITEDSDAGETVFLLREIHQELKEININTDREDCGWTESIGDADPEGETNPKG